jgi:hypothetical protein
MGRLLFLPRFLQARYFCVRLGNVLSARYPQENGVQQGSVLSVALFAISLNGLMNEVRPSVTTSLYVEDVAIYYISRSMGTLECRPQVSIDHSSRWSRENDFTFSHDRTKVLHFTCLRGLHSAPACL